MDSYEVPGTRPPSLSSFSLGVSLFLALKVPRGDHTLKDSQQSAVSHLRAPTQQLANREVSHSTLYKARKAARCGYSRRELPFVAAVFVVVEDPAIFLLKVPLLVCDVFWTIAALQDRSL